MKLRTIVLDDYLIPVKFELDIGKGNQDYAGILFGVDDPTSANLDGLSMIADSFFTL